MKRFLFVMLLALVLPALAAQTPADTSGDAEAEQLRQQIRERWNARVRQDLNLSDDQAAKLQGTEQKFTQQRVELAQRQRTVNEALRGQLQPGVAANSDSVRKLMDARDRNRPARAEIERNENRQVPGYLPPPQQPEHAPMRVRPGNQEREAAVGAAQGGLPLVQGSPGGAPRAYAVSRTPARRGSHRAAQARHHGPHARPNREHLQQGTGDGERPAMDLEDGFDRCEGDDAVPGAAAQRAGRAGPDPGPLL